MGLEHQHVSFEFILHRFSKMAITFSTDLGLMQFKSHFKAKTWIYLPPKNNNFWLGQSLPASSQTLSYFFGHSSLTD